MQIAITLNGKSKIYLNEKNRITPQLLRLKYNTILNGAQRRNRTTDTWIFSPLLYRLSYLGKKKLAEKEGFEPSWA